MSKFWKVTTINDVGSYMTSGLYNIREIAREVLRGLATRSVYSVRLTIHDGVSPKKELARFSR